VSWVRGEKRCQNCSRQLNGPNPSVQFCYNQVPFREAEIQR
jgi:hypothetical protein